MHGRTREEGLTNTREDEGRGERLLFFLLIHGRIGKGVWL